jgi:hypothetical protein
MAIEAHGGFIDFSTQKGEGTTFFFNLHKGTNKGPLPMNLDNKFNSFHNSFHEIFDEQEKQHLSDVTKKLNELEPYQIGKIKKVLAEANQNNPKVKSWVKEIKKAVFNSDSRYYKYLIDMVKQN